MLTREETELLTRVGRGTPMGELLRRYWLPACLSEELPEPDSDPLRVRLLGENLVAFRDSEGRVGLLEEHCPHRGASLVLGRNEEGGLRCLYHGWKMDVAGLILDAPCEPAGSTFKDRVRAVAYPTCERGGIVWAYLGPAAPPPFPAFEWMGLPDEQRSFAKVREECNFLQAVEGIVDSSHADILHSGHAIMDTWHQDAWGRPSHDSAPRIEIEDTPTGFRYAAIRKHLEDPGQRYVRITVFAMPFHGLVAGESQIHMFVPIDDEHTWNYNLFFARDRPVDHQKHLESRRQVIGVDLHPDRRKIRSLENNFLQDRAAMRAKQSFSGIAGSGPNQDMAVLESMGPIYDRTREHLGASDVAVIHLRKRLLEAVRSFQAGGEPLGAMASVADLRGRQFTLPSTASWQEVS